MTESALALVACDAGPVIHLNELGRLGLLSSFAKVLIPTAVWLEVQRHRPTALELRCLERTSAATPEPPERESIALALNLHTGEWEAIRAAMEHHSSTLLTDDTAARLAANNLGVRVHSTIGILVRSVRQGHRSKAEVLGILSAIPTSSTLHLKRSLLDVAIAQVADGA